MDWLTELQPLKGVDRFVAEMGKRLMSGPLIFKSPYWDGDIVIENLDEYRAWVRTVQKIANKQGTEKRGLEIWKTGKKGDA